MTAISISTTMACDVTVKPDAENPCCSVWKEKCLKLGEGRKFLRQALNLLTEQTDKIQAENASLKKACEDERVRAETEKELKEKELAARISLDNEISVLKSEILSLQQKGNVADLEGKERELTALQDCICKGEKEIDNLKELLEKEKQRTDSLKKIAEAEKKNAADAWNQVKVEKLKADDERNHAHVEGRKAEEFRLQLEALKKKVDEAKSKSVFTDLNIEETSNGKSKAEKNRVNREKKNGEYDTANAEEQCKLAEENEKIFTEAWSFAENNSQQWETAKEKKIESQKDEQYVLQLQATKQEAESMKSKLVSETLKLEETQRKLKVEKSNAIKERKRADSELFKTEKQRKRAEACEKKFVEERSRANHLSLLLEAAENRIKELEKEVNQLKSEGLDIERQKTMVEKMRADSEMLRAEEQRKLADVNKKMAEEERSRAEQLHHQHKEDRLKIGDLQKQIQELLSSRKILENPSILPDKTTNSQTTDVKLLKKQLKLEKKRLKHAKEVANFEKTRSSILQHEFHRLKLDLLPISCRLDVVDKCFSSCNEGTKSLKKVGGFADLQWSKLDNIYGIKPCRLDRKSEGELLKSRCTGFTASDPLRQAPGSTAPLFPISGGRNDAESMSGIDSKLESLLGGSDQKLLHSSAINSSSASFSDGQLVRSQEMGASVTTSKNLVEEENFNAQVPIISGELSEMTHNGNQTTMPENSVKSPNKVDVVGIVKRHGTKRRRETDNNEFLCSKDKRLHLKMEDKLSDLHGVLSGPQLLDKPDYVDSNIQGRTHLKLEKMVRKGKISREKVVLRQDFTDSHEVTKAKSVENAFVAGTDASKFASLSTNCLTQKTSLDCSEGYLGIGLEDMESFEEVANGNYMKLLDLEDAADEELYRRALAMPMSPSLPDIVDSSAEMFNMDMDKLEPMYDMRAAEVSDNQSVGSRLEVEIPNMPKFRDESLNFGVNSELRSVQEKLPAYLVISSSISEPGSVTRVFSATRSCMAYCSFGAHAESMVREIFHGLKMEKELTRREKACTFFTLLLLNFSACTWGKAGTFLNEDFVSCLDSFRRDIDSVVSDIEARSSFAEDCCVDELLGLVEEFLMDGRVVVHTDTSSNPMFEHDSVLNIFLDGKNIDLSLKSTPVELLMAGSIILGSICSAIDHLGFLCEASYNILRVRRFDTATVLTILHILAYTGGEKFFSLEDYSLTMTVLKAVVMFLEERSSSAASDSDCLPSRNTVMSVFNPCAKCLFLRGAVPIATVISMLFEKLQTFVITGQMQLANLSNFIVLDQKDRSNQSFSDEEVHSDVHICHEASCSLHKCMLPATKLNSVITDLSDLLSLLELLACYLSWEGTSGKIIPLLLQMLDRGNSENLLVAVFILLGQIGKIGVASCGYEDGGVGFLMHKLCGYLSGETGVKLAFPVQIAAVSALLGILCLDFEEAVSVSLEIRTAESQHAFSVCISKWFYSLGKKQQVLACSLLQPAAVVVRN